MAEGTKCCRGLSPSADLMASCSASSNEDESKQPVSSVAMTTAVSAAELSASLSVNTSTAATEAGMLRVEIRNARSLPAAVLGSLLKWSPSYSNPYVVLTLARDAFMSSTKEKTLNPAWKEVGFLPVPLPSEADAVAAAGYGHDKMTESVSTKKTVDKLAAKSVGKGKKLDGERSRAPDEYQPCFPELLVQVFHRADATLPAVAASSGAQAARGAEDKLIGFVRVPLLPCLLSTSSSHRAWYSLVGEDNQSAGQLQLALHFEAGDIELMKGDIVRLAGFGGADYYAKLLPMGVRMEVVDTFQDQVLVQYKSVEGWMLSYELHRNILHLVHRPSIIRDAHTQLTGSLSRMRHAPLVARAEGLWMALPERHRLQLLSTYQFSKYTTHAAYAVLAQAVNETLVHGVRAGAYSCAAHTADAYGKVKMEFKQTFWAPNPSSMVVRRVDEDMDLLLDCGPRKARGRIVAGFTPDDRFSDEEIIDDYDEDDEMDDAVPEQLICPITGCPMTDPVVAADGHTYEREAIMHWFSTSDISPLTGMHIPTTQVFPNFTLRKLSEEFQEARRSRFSRRR